MGDLSFHALDLDGTYDTLEKINQLAISDGNMLIENLKKLVLDLKNHWIGNDATIHINNLIKIYDSVRNVVQNVNLVAHNTSEPIVNAQTIRNANGGAGEVDKIIPIENGKSDTIEILQSTKEYYVDPVLVPQDLVDLQVQKDAFNNFCTKFSGYKDELLNNWLSGSDRPKAINDFTDFEKDIANFKKIFSDAEQTLSIVVSNLKTA